MLLCYLPHIFRGGRDAKYYIILHPLIVYLIFSNLYMISLIQRLCIGGVDSLYINNINLLARREQKARIAFCWCD